MPNTLREVWLRAITPDDYDAHMAAAGQAQVNAALTAGYLRTAALGPGARLLMAGAGTGQIFDWLDAGTLRPFHTTFTDLNPAFLDRLRHRIGAAAIPFETAVDDLEDSLLTGPFALAIVVLVLEHVDCCRAVVSLCRLARRVFVVIQENPPGGSPVRTPVGTVAALLETPPHVVPQSELEAAFACASFERTGIWSAAVPDGKRMLALEFTAPRHADIP